MANLIRRQPFYRGWQEIVFTESAEVEVCPLLADVVCFGHDLPWQLLLDSQTPRLFVGNVVADRGNWTEGTKSDVVRSTQ